MFCCFALADLVDPGRLALDLARLHRGVERGEDRFDVAERPARRSPGCCRSRSARCRPARAACSRSTAAARPCDKSQLSRAPATSTTSALPIDIGAGGGGRLRMVVGQQALGHRHRQERHAGRLDKRADLVFGPRIGRALAEDRERALRLRQQVERAARPLPAPGGCGGAGSTTLISDFRPVSASRAGAEHLGGQVEIDAARPPGDGGADRPRDADADILRAVDAVGRLGIGPGGGELVHLLVIALFEIDDRAVGRAADQDHREAVGRRVGQRDQPVQKAGGRDGHADARLLGQKPGDRGGVAGRLLVPEAEIADALLPAPGATDR